MVEGSWLAEFAPAYFDISSFPEGRMKAELVFVYSRLLGVWVCLLDEGGSDYRVESVSRYSIGCVPIHTLFVSSKNKQHRCVKEREKRMEQQDWG